MIYLGLGSNRGDRLEYLVQAVTHLHSFFNIRIMSPIYETIPWGEPNQENFYNQCVGGTTKLTPYALLQAIKTLESELGRSTTERWGPREIDIDILLYHQLRFQSRYLTIPHPELKNRLFVLRLLMDIAPNLILPGESVTISDLVGPPESQGDLLRLVDSYTHLVKSSVSS
jgi:2-amino-4-hydroxy-6-hydroxymethyldihydropteridine diphosphokinase